MSINPIFPSILSTNFFDLEERLNAFLQLKLDFIHLDIMDGHFVDNISFGPSAAPSIKSKFPFKLDSHLMVSNPSRIIPKFVAAGSEWVSFHIETGDRIAENIDYLHGEGCKAGLVLNPDTDVEKVYPYLKNLDYVLLMSVFPGYGGQKFIPETLDRVKQLKGKIQEENPACLIQVDGGINTSFIRPLREAGADLFVIGTFLFNSENISETASNILDQYNGV